MKRTYTKLFCLVIAMGIACNCFAQGKRIDSLLVVLKTVKEDTAKVKLLRKVAHMAVDRGNHKLADSLLHSSLSLSQTLNYKAGIAASYNNLGIVYDDLGEYPTALENYYNALKVERELHNYVLCASYLNNIGFVYHKEGNFSKALDCFFRALSLADSVDAKDARINALNFIGNVYLAQNDNDKALEYYGKALKADEANKDEQGIAPYLYNNIGLIYENQKDTALALAYFEKGLKVCVQQDDKQAISEVLGNIGNVYQTEGNYSMAHDYYIWALDTAKSAESKENIMSALNDLGNLFSKQKKYPEALQYAKQCLDLAKGIGSLDGIKITEELLSQIYSGMGDDIKSLEHYKAFIKARDSIFNKQNTKKMVQSEMNFEFEKKQATEKAEQDKKDALQQEQAHKQTLVIYFFSGILLLVFGFAIFAYRSNLQKKKANAELDQKNKKIENAYKVIEEKNHEITDSITYAKRIQHAILPTVADIKKAIPQTFVLFKPKDIVSGDFYFFKQSPSTLFIAAADCTGHGVPGAFMSMIGSEKLHDMVQQSNDTGEILTLLNKGIRTSLHQSEQQSSTRDGMDIALCAITASPHTSPKGRGNEKPQVSPIGGDLEGAAISLQYSGANRPLWIIRNKSNEIEELKPTKNAIGGFTETIQKFESHNLTLNTGDTIYLFTDGYADQFGGADGKKLTTKKFRELILSVRNKTMEEQQTALGEFIEKWKGSREQLDDILVIGIRI